MYCVKCGVELADSQRVCPLCGTRVFHPDIPRTPADPPYPPDERVHPEEVNRSGVCFILTALALLPAVICVLCDWRINGGILWSGYASGGILLLYVLTVLPLWFKRPNPVIFVPLDFAAIILYLLYIDLATGGHWFLTFAFPVAGSIGVLITTVARIPSVITSTIGGDALGTENYLFAVVVFAATALISGVGVLVYRQITKHHRKKEQEREAAEKAGHNALDGSTV